MLVLRECSFHCIRGLRTAPEGIPSSPSSFFLCRSPLSIRVIIDLAGNRRKSRYSRLLVKFPVHGNRELEDRWNVVREDELEDDPNERDANIHVKKQKRKKKKERRKRKDEKTKQITNESRSTRSWIVDGTHEPRASRIEARFEIHRVAHPRDDLALGQPRCSSSSGHRRTTEGCGRRAPEPGTPTRHDPLEHCTVFQDQFGRFTWLRRKDAVRGCSPPRVAPRSPPLAPSSAFPSLLARWLLLSQPPPRRHSSRSPPFRTRCPLVLADESLLSRERRVGRGQETRTRRIRPTRSQLLADPRG